MAESEEEAKAPAVMLIDPDLASRNLGEDLEDDLERPVFAVDSMDLDFETSEEAADADTFVICWDLGFRCGIDLIEEIRQTPGFSDRVILVAVASPTRSIVRRAILSGADGVCSLPYDGDEIVARLAEVQERRAQSEAA